MDDDLCVSLCSRSGRVIDDDHRCGQCRFIGRHRTCGVTEAAAEIIDRDQNPWLYDGPSLYWLRQGEIGN